ncbi:uncharacterized protein BBOV_IV006930 [Babesia bovis T2Bo]|uniref:uncharacterized protein n=1 Tax=Babesia bovis T2Bo TaxID=484906 RepID=UPI001E059C7B|nr:uncharacterized protein BBOV_IV006930 [Babesia bovis T2Bo]EDO07049.2 hypothetical protein BBOV_IV006930 [Babesia bovis T2Bo]
MADAAFSERLADHSTMDKVVLDPDVYCSLVKCAFNQAFQRKSEMNQHSLLFKQLVNSLLETPDSDKTIGPPKPNPGVLSGNLKESIDAIKTDFLDHYSLLYNLEEYSIRERLEILGRHTTVENTLHHESVGVSRNQPDELGYGGDTGIPEDDQPDEGTVSHGVFDMINSLKNKFEKLNQRIEALDNELDAQVGDPNLREWEKSPESYHQRGEYDLEGDQELCDHIRNLYAHLHHQAKINNQKIEAMRNRLSTLQAHAKVLRRRDPHDTRIGL